MLRRTPSGFIEPCRPSRTTKPPPGPGFEIHEIKHEGFRLLVRREGARVRSYTKNGYDWADRFPAIVEAASRLKASSFLIDGEAVVLRPDGLSDSNALRSRHCGAVLLGMTDHFDEGEVVICYGAAKPCDVHLASRIVAVDDEILKILDRRERR